MPDEKKTDPFKPSAPSIPGVTPSGSTGASAGSARTASPQALVGVAVAAVVIFIVVASLLFWRHGSSPKASERSPDPAPAAPVTTAAKPAEALPTGPGPVGTTDELEKTWAAKKFLFRDPITSEPVPSMLVHLPGGSYWAFSLREPFGNCELEYVSDLHKLQTNYNFHAEHPMVGNTCNHTVYDLMRYGGASNGGLVRGEIVQGSGIRPPMAIEVRVDGKQLVTVRME